MAYELLFVCLSFVSLRLFPADEKKVTPLQAQETPLQAQESNPAPGAGNNESQLDNESQLAFAAPAYELAMTLGVLFNGERGNLSGDQIVNKFSSVAERQGVAAGPYRYINDSKTGQYFQFPIVVKKIVGNNFEAIQ